MRRENHEIQAVLDAHEAPDKQRCMTCRSLHSYPVFELRVLDIQGSQTSGRMKSSVRKAKAKVGQLLVNLRPESRLQSLVSPDLDPGPAPSVTSSSDTKSQQVPQSPRDASSQSSTSLMGSTQTVVTPSSVPQDLNPISPAALSGLQTQPSDQGDAVLGSVEPVSSTTNPSLRRVPVRTTRVDL